MINFVLRLASLTLGAGLCLSVVWFFFSLPLLGRAVLIPGVVMLYFAIAPEAHQARLRSVGVGLFGSGVLVLVLISETQRLSDKFALTALSLFILGVWTMRSIYLVAQRS